MGTFALHHVQLAMPKGGEDRARQFFVDILGMVELEKPETLGKRCGVWFASGDTQVHMGVEVPFSPALKAHPAFLVDDLAGLRCRLVAALIAVRDDADLPGYQRFYCDDPFGNRIEFLEAFGGADNPGD